MPLILQFAEADVIAKSGIQVLFGQLWMGEKMIVCLMVHYLSIVLK
jgi:hypothetical protein